MEGGGIDRFEELGHEIETIPGNAQKSLVLGNLINAISASDDTARVLEQADRVGKRQNPGLDNPAIVMYPIRVIDFHHRAHNCKRESDGTQKAANMFSSSRRFKRLMPVGVSSSVSRLNSGHKPLYLAFNFWVGIAPCGRQVAATGDCLIVCATFIGDQLALVHFC